MPASRVAHRAPYRRPRPVGTTSAARVHRADPNDRGTARRSLDRSVAGHWEGDLIVGGVQPLRDRHSRRAHHPLHALVHLDGPSRRRALARCLIDLFGDCPTLRRSLSWDQGSEIATTTRSPRRPACRCSSAMPAGRGNARATRTQRAPPRLLPQRHRPAAARPSTAPGRRRGTQPTATQDPRLEDPATNCSLPSETAARVATTAGTRRATLGNFSERRHHPYTIWRTWPTGTQ